MEAQTEAETEMEADVAQGEYKGEAVASVGTVKRVCFIVLHRIFALNPSKRNLYMVFSCICAGVLLVYSTIYCYIHISLVL